MKVFTLDGLTGPGTEHERLGDYRGGGSAIWSILSTKADPKCIDIVIPDLH